MIRTFSDKGLARFAATGDTRGLKVQNSARVRRILTSLNNATKPEDMNVPGNRFHAYAGSRKGTYSVDVTGNYRLTFRWDAADAIDVQIEDPH